MTGTADGIGVNVVLSEPDIAVRFLKELAAGTAISLYNADGARLATFSLRGSAAALGAAGTCWDRIKNTDPFGDADPFTSSAPMSDPF